MKLSQKQQQDLQTAMYFIPVGCNFDEITQADIQTYFEWSDQGKPHGRNTMIERDGFCALFWGKQRRDLQVSSYKEDWGYHITSVDFVDEPKFLVEWLSRIMKKPGLLDMWVAHNEPNNLTIEQKKRMAEAFAPLMVTRIDPVVYKDPNFSWLKEIMERRYPQWVKPLYSTQ